eukprot:scaffold386_cov107-Skeletonema_dohrnii-CCMP3373.AAC.3
MVVGGGYISGGQDHGWTGGSGDWKLEDLCERLPVAFSLARRSSLTRQIRNLPRQIDFAFEAGPLATPFNHGTNELQLDRTVCIRRLALASALKVLVTASSYSRNKKSSL